MSALSRRGMLGSVAALVPIAATLAASPAALPTGPDAALIAACQAMMAAQQAYNAVWDGPHAIEDDNLAEVAAAPFVAHWGALLPELERLRATTPAGVAARAQTLAFHAQHGGFTFDAPDTMTGRMLGYLLRDAAGLPTEVLT